MEKRNNKKKIKRIKIKERNGKKQKRGEREKGKTGKRGTKLTVVQNIGECFVAHGRKITVLETAD